MIVKLQPDDEGNAVLEIPQELLDKLGWVEGQWLQIDPQERFAVLPGGERDSVEMLLKITRLHQ